MKQPNTKAFKIAFIKLNITRLHSNSHTTYIYIDNERLTKNPAGQPVLPVGRYYSPFPPRKEEKASLQVEAIEWLDLATRSRAYGARHRWRGWRWCGN